MALYVMVATSKLEEYLAVDREPMKLSELFRMGKAI